MSVTIRMPTWYYRQHHADYALEVPAEGFGGWERTELDFDIGRTAVVVMHACDCGTPAQSPGRYRSVEYLPRANEIAERVFPAVLGAVRNAGIRVFHVPFPGRYYQHLPGYRETMRLAGPPAPAPETIASDAVADRLRDFKAAHVFPGAGNDAGDDLNFYPQAAPVGDEPIADDERQLFALCKAHNINHLVYTGFAIDGCLLTSSGGMLDMARRGLLCSTIREAVTAIETKETARHLAAKQLALWRVAVLFGFVYDADDFVEAVSGRD